MIQKHEEQVHSDDAGGDDGDDGDGEGGAGGPGGAAAEELAREQAGQDDGNGGDKGRRQAQGPLVFAEGFDGGDEHPEEEGRFVEVGFAEQLRGEVVAALDHVAGDEGAAGLVGFDEGHRGGAEHVEGGEGDDGERVATSQQPPAAAGRRAVGLCLARGRRQHGHVKRHMGSPHVRAMPRVRTDVGRMQALWMRGAAEGWRR